MSGSGGGGSSSSGGRGSGVEASSESQDQNEIDLVRRYKELGEVTVTATPQVKLEIAKLRKELVKFDDPNLA